MKGKSKTTLALTAVIVLCTSAVATAAGSLPVKISGPKVVKAGQVVSFHLQVSVRPGPQNELIFVSNTVNGTMRPVIRGAKVSPGTEVLNKNQLVYWYWLGNSPTARQDWILRVTIPRAPRGSRYCLGVTARNDKNSWLGGTNPPEQSFCVTYAA